MEELSEKRTYIINGEMIFITKVKKIQKPKNEVDEYLVTFENLTTKETYTVNGNTLYSAVKTVDSTEFFKMWMHFNNYKNRDSTYAAEFSKSIISHLAERKIELHGSGKFEKYDLNHFVEMYNYTEISNSELCDIISDYDCGYSYLYTFSEIEREKYDIAKNLADYINN